LTISNPSVSITQSSHALSHAPIPPPSTAGLRLLPADQAQAIIDVCQASLEASPFLVTSLEAASVISGQDEGLYAWISINFLLGRLQRKYTPLSTISILELGGASMQASCVIFLLLFMFKIERGQN